MSRATVVMTSAVLACFGTLFSGNAAHAQGSGLEPSLAVIELYLGEQDYTKTVEYVERIADEVGKTERFSMLTRGDAERVIGKKMTTSSRKVTDDKLREIEQMMKKGDKLLYEDPRQAIEILAEAKKRLKKIMESISLNQKIRQDFFKTQMLLARSHFDNQNKEKAASILEEIIRIFGDEVQVTEADYHPNIVQLYRQAYRKLSEVPKGGVYVKTMPKGAQVLIHGKPQKKASPATYSGLFPGTVSIQARINGRESMIHKVQIEAGQTKELAIDIDYETSLSFTKQRFGFTFPDAATMKNRVADFASRVGGSLGVDFVLVAGLVEMNDRTFLKGFLVDVKQVAVSRTLSLFTKANVVSNNRVKQLAMAVADSGYKIETVYKPWYTNWVGWSLAGAGVIGLAVGGVLWSDYLSQKDTAENCTAPPPTCPSFEERLNIAADAQTMQSLGGALFGVGGLLIAGSVVAFILMKEEDLDGGEDVGVFAPRLKSLSPMVGAQTTGIGATFSF